MSYANLKSLVIKNNEVIVRSCDSNVYPKSYEPYVSSYLTKNYNENGEKKVLEILTIDMINGGVKIVGNTKLLSRLKEGYEKITNSEKYIEILNRQHFLEGKIFSKERELYIDEYRTLNKRIENLVSEFYK